MEKQLKVQMCHVYQGGRNGRQKARPPQRGQPAVTSSSEDSVSGEGREKKGLKVFNVGRADHEGAKGSYMGVVCIDA